MGYDFYSFYLVLKKMGCIKTLALGRYRLRFGMGLVMNNNFSLASCQRYHPWEEVEAI